MVNCDCGDHHDLRCKNSVIGSIVRLGDSYPSDWRLRESEVELICNEAEEGLKTTNGDTSPVTITVRQFSLLLANLKSEFWESL